MLIQAAGSNVTVAQGTPAPAIIELNALVEQQVQSITRLVQMEGERASIQRRLNTATGREADGLRRDLSQVEGIIAGEKAKIEAFKGRIAEAKQNAPATFSIAETPPPFPEDRVFGMNKTESTFAFFLALPVVIAICVRAVRRKPAPRSAIMGDDRLARLEQAVESVAIEVERIGESQRFQAKLMADKQPEAERAEVRR